MDTNSSPEMSLREMQAGLSNVSARNAWTVKRSADLLRPAVRVAVKATHDVPAGVIGVYSYRWRQGAWCGDVDQVERADFTQRLVEHPAVPAGHTLELWVERVDLSLAWGVLVPTNTHGSGLNQDFEAIKTEAGRRLKSGARPFDTLPGRLQERAVETGKGTSADTWDDCCGC